MNAEEKRYQKTQIKTAVVSQIISIAVALVVAMSTGYGFFYQTKSTLDIHSRQIQEIKNNLNNATSKINDINVDSGISETQLTLLQSKVNKLENQIEKMDDKLDRILLQTK